MVQGYIYGAAVSVIVTDLYPADGPRLHWYPYGEDFVVPEEEDTATSTVGDVVVPGSTEHKFMNSGRAQAGGRTHQGPVGRRVTRMS